MNYENRNRGANALEKDENRDPITGAPGSHPLGTGVGAAGGAAAGAAIGTVGGPVGAAVGLVTGAIVGGLAGKGFAEGIDPTVEDAYWRDNYEKQTYVQRGLKYDIYRPAYRAGYEGYGRYRGRSYDDVEAELQREYEQSGGSSTLAWEQAKHATRDAWRRVENSSSGKPR
ncbi:MAG TPA: hypothetical protein VHB20_06185 [Verrucomicrobiae bacterium]|jgi:hypothetical protein|nr:hypothetical protein [Verrucomicrobiae bacterium]